MKMDRNLKFHYIIQRDLYGYIDSELMKWLNIFACICIGVFVLIIFTLGVTFGTIFNIMNFIIGSFFGIFLIFAMILLWPMISCKITISNDRIYFNEIKLGVLYKPIRMVKYVDIIKIIYYRKYFKEMYFYIKKRKKPYILQLRDLQIEKRRIILSILKKRGIKIYYKPRR